MNNKKLIFSLSLATTAILALSNGIGVISSDTLVIEANRGQIATSTVHVKKSAELIEELRPICGCESGGNPKAKPVQFNSDGTVLRGVVNSDDIGMCQINKKYHEAAAVSMDMDIYTEEGNIEYANWLYKHQGSRPWNWSRQCWSKSVVE